MPREELLPLRKVLRTRLSVLLPHAQREHLNYDLGVALDIIDEHLAAMAVRIAERDERLARLRREMDALREGLRSAHDPELIAHDVMVAAKAVAP